MSFWQKILEKLSLADVTGPPDDKEGSLVYVLIPGSISPTDRGAQFEDALEAELQIAGLGVVSGGGSLLSDEKPDGSRDIIHCGIDIDAVEVDAVRDLLRMNLPELGAPCGTQIHFESTDGRSFFDEFDGSNWRLSKPWDGDDPRFG